MKRLRRVGNSKTDTTLLTGACILQALLIDRALVVRMALGYAHTVLTNLFIAAIGCMFARDRYSKAFDILITGEARWTQACFIAIYNAALGVQTARIVRSAWTKSETVALSLNTFFAVFAIVVSLAECCE